MELDGEPKSGDNIEENPTLNENEVIEAPAIGMSFGTMEEAFAYYSKYAKEAGFCISKQTKKLGDDGELRYFTLACTRAGKRVVKSLVNPLRPSLSTKIDCKAKIRATLMHEKFVLTTVVLEHNHDLLPSEFRHFRSNKRMDIHVKRRLELNDQAGIGVAKNFNSLVVEAGGYDNLSFDEKDCRNYIEKARRLRLGEGDAESIRNYFERMQAHNSSFFYVMDFDDDCHIRNLFWADARSRATYVEFGDAISFDTTYLTNKYDMPFAPFVGVNHHGQSVLLGCGLLSNEDTNTFVWLFKSWLACMSGCPPKAIITDQCKAMQKAIEIVFPHARHRWCLWHIMKKIPEKLRGYSEYEGIKMALQNAVYDSLTKCEFEEEWKVMIETFNLYDNEWLGVLYGERYRWVPVFVNDIFWAGMSTTQRSESMNAFFDGYVNSKTTLKQFVEQYDNALRTKVEKEKKSDFKSLNQMYDCLTYFDIEKQFQRVYTNAKFKEVQEQLKRMVYCSPLAVKVEGSISTYNVTERVKVCERLKSVVFVVYFNSIECEVKCMCHLFEFRGIMCGHSLSVLNAREVKEVPEIYILPRWRKDLKRGYTFISTSYNELGAGPNAKQCGKMYQKLNEIVALAANCEEKCSIVLSRLDEIKDEVLKDDSACQKMSKRCVRWFPKRTHSDVKRCL